MKFQHKLIVTYGLFLSLFVLSLGVYLYRNNSRLILEETLSSYSRVGESVIQQLDNIYDQMDFVLLSLLSREDFKTALTTLETIDREDTRYPDYYNEASSVLKDNLLTYSLQKEYHSIAYMNRQTDFFSSNIIEHPRLRTTNVSVDSIFPLNELYAWSNSLIISPHEDPWGINHIEVFGWGRLIRSSDENISLLIAQKPYEVLLPLFSLAEGEFVDMLLLRPDGMVFYESRTFSPEQREYYKSLSDKDEGGTDRSENVLLFPPSRWGFTMVIIIDKELSQAAIRQARIVIIAGMIFLLTFSLLFDYVSSRMLTRPLAQITEFMKSIELHSMPGHLDLNDSHDEISELNAAFHELIQRLDESTRREIQISTSWLQAKMDALQGQINPHFLFNVLTVISQRAYTLGDREICRTCDEIADMLRYSTSTASRSADINDELAHTENYLSLMKRRLGDDLEYNIKVEEATRKMEVPKMVLQPLVENALNHGFKDIVRRREIRIEGCSEDKGWTVKVTDNGQGFDSSKMEEKFAQIRDQMQQGQSSQVFQIGGLGLANTFARFHLFFGKKLIWQIESSTGKGTTVMFGCQKGETHGT